MQHYTLEIRCKAGVNAENPKHAQEQLESVLESWHTAYGEDQIIIDTAEVVKSNE